MHKALPEKNASYYVMPTDKALYGALDCRLLTLTRIPTHFGIRHYAGLVFYNSADFIQKNRNTQAVLLNAALLTSNCELVRKAGDTEMFEEKSKVPLSRGFRIN